MSAFQIRSPLRPGGDDLLHFGLKRIDIEQSLNSGTFKDLYSVLDGLINVLIYNDSIVQLQMIRFEDCCFQSSENGTLGFGTPKVQPLGNFSCGSNKKNGFHQ